MFAEPDHDGDCTGCIRGRPWPGAAHRQEADAADLRESGSIEQDADVVLLVHREDMYERASPRAGEADIIIAKHRNGPTGNTTVAFQGHLSRFVDMPN